LSPATQDLIEELNAWNPRWQTSCKSIGDAALQAGARDQYLAWIKTEDGRAYLARFGNVPDREGASKREYEAYSSVCSAFIIPNPNRKY
jgi:hypothetical protein